MSTTTALSTPTPPALSCITLVGAHNAASATTSNPNSSNRHDSTPPQPQPQPQPERATLLCSAPHTLTLPNGLPTTLTLRLTSPRPTTLTTALTPPPEPAARASALLCGPAPGGAAVLCYTAFERGSFTTTAWLVATLRVAVGPTGASPGVGEGEGHGGIAAGRVAAVVVTAVVGAALVVGLVAVLVVRRRRRGRMQSGTVGSDAASSVTMRTLST